MRAGSCGTAYVCPTLQGDLPGKAAMFFGSETSSKTALEGHCRAFIGSRTLEVAGLLLKVLLLLGKAP
jgi:hypothetical protein